MYKYNVNVKVSSGRFLWKENHGEFSFPNLSFANPISEHSHVIAFIGEERVYLGQVESIDHTGSSQGTKAVSALFTRTHYNSSYTAFLKAEDLGRLRKGLEAKTDNSQLAVA